MGWNMGPVRIGTTMLACRIKIKFIKIHQKLTNYIDRLAFCRVIIVIGSLLTLLGLDVHSDLHRWGEGGRLHGCRGDGIYLEWMGQE